MAFDRAAWVREHKAELAAYLREYNKKNREWLAIQKRNYSASKKAKALRAKRDARPEKRKEAVERASQWAKDNKDRVNAKNAAWKKAHPESVSKLSSEYRAREIGAPGSHTTKQTKALLVAQNHRCANPYCCVDLRIVKRHLDHKVALKRGGSNGIENLQWLCEPCNMSKGPKDYDEWLRKQGKKKCA